MTNSADEPLAPKHDDLVQPNVTESESAAELEQEGVDAAGENAEEGLPEWVPLTPELLEDEAIRGDFVIRWAVVGLALLLGISQIAESRTLLHLKSGQYLFSHGIIPTGTDPFSYTAADRRWVNLPWLFDLVMAGVHGLSGGFGLSIIQGLIVGLTFALLAHTVKPNIRTWWGSICAVLALLTCYSQFTVQPELITMLGVSFVLWTLVQYQEAKQTQLIWGLVPGIWLWSQMDSRAWIGIFILILWMVGNRLASTATTMSANRLFEKVTLISLGVMLVHPFLWETWLAPIRTYLTDYAAIRDAYPDPSSIDAVYFPIWHEKHWLPVAHRTIAFVALFAATIVTFVLNLKRTSLPLVLVFVGANTLAALATHEFAAASLVNCVVCTLNAQTWYRERFGQVYTLQWREMLFSSGGRAVTVIGFFVLAWFVLSGRLDGPDGKRTGVGFDVHLANAMQDYQTMATSFVDDHPFNFSIRQADLMIWGGQKTFVDSRLGHFHGSGERNLISLHHDTRTSLNKSSKTLSPDFWRPVFAKYQIRQACPRLNGPVPRPDHETFSALLQSPEFQLTSLNSSTAVFVLKEPADEKVVEFLKEHSFDLPKLAFESKLESPTDSIREYAKPATWYDSLFSVRRNIVPGDVQFAQHLFRLAAVTATDSRAKRAAATLLMIRHANQGLRDDPNSADGYRLLGLAYFVLGQLEGEILNQGGQATGSMLRYYQTVMALQQALALLPDDTSTMGQLIGQYQMSGRVDVQLELLRRFRELRPVSVASSDRDRQDDEKLGEAIDKLAETLSRIDNAAADFLSKGADRLQVATGAFQAGGLLKAIKLLEEDGIYLAQNPVAKVALASWLMEIGRVQQAAELFESLKQPGVDLSFFNWKEAAGFSSLAVANYLEAIRLWVDQIETAKSTQVTSLLNTLPFVTLNPEWIGPDSYPVSNVASTAQFLQSIKIDGAKTEFEIAMAYLEMGANDEATKSIRQALEINPATAYRPLLRFYLECLTGEKIELKVESPETEDFTEISATETKQEGKTEEKTAPATSEPNDQK